MPRGKAKSKNGKAGKAAKKNGNGNGHAAAAASADATPGPAETPTTPAPQEPVAKLVRKNKTTNVIEPRKPGRPHPDYEYGYLDAQGAFHQGDPVAKKRKPGRPAGSVNKAGRIDLNVKFGRKAKGQGLDAIGEIVAQEVKSRLQEAKAAAIDAFTKALDVG